MYPGKAVRLQDTRRDIVKQVQAQLTAVNCGPLSLDGDFGSQTESSVKLFQSRRALRPVDGVVGPVTWDALFDEQSPLIAEAPSTYLRQVVQVACAQLGVRELKGYPNRGKEVDEYLINAGFDPMHGPPSGYPWCAAFVYWCFTQAATQLGVTNPLARTGWVFTFWDRAPKAARVTAEAAADDPSLIKPGSVFIIDHGNQKGHTGLVRALQGGEILTVEGNTSLRGSREGDGVYELRRHIGEVNVGFLQFMIPES
jgi:hypothetical protein